MKASLLTKALSALFVVLISLSFFSVRQAEADAPPPQPRLSVSFDKTSVNLGEWVTITANLRNYGGATSNGASVYLIFPTNLYAFGRERVQVLSHNFDQAEIYNSNGYLVVLASKNNWPGGADSSLRVKFQPSAAGMFFVNTSSRVAFWQNNQFKLYEDPSSGSKNSLDLYFNSHSIMVWQAAVVLPSPTAWIPPSPMPIPPTFTPVPTRTPFPTFAPMPTITPMPTATRVIQSNNALTPQPFFVSAPTATSQVFVNPTMTAAAVATTAATATAVQQQATQTPLPGAPTSVSVPTSVPASSSVPVSAPASASESELRELEQLINDIKAEVELLQQELNQQRRQPTLANIIGYEYAYAGIPDEFAFQKNIAQGASGEDVRYLHIFLNGAGCFISFSDNESEDEKSKFVSRTKEAVACFQERYAKEILSPLGLVQGTGFFAAKSRIKANQILEKAREERNRYLESQLIADSETIQAPPALLESIGEEAKEIFELANDPAVSLALIPAAPEFAPGIIGFYITSKILSLKEMKAALQSVNAAYKIAKETAFVEQNANAVKQSVSVLKQAMLQYVQKYGAEGLAFLNKMVGKLPATKFDWERELDNLYDHAWPKHGNEFENLGVKTLEQFKAITIEVVQGGRKAVYQIDGNNHFGFYDETRNIFVAAKENGELVTAFRPTNGNVYFEGLKLFFELK